MRSVRVLYVLAVVPSPGRAYAGRWRCRGQISVPQRAPVASVAALTRSGDL